MIVKINQKNQFETLIAGHPLAGLENLTISVV
jgi:hypothetical protein